MVLKWYFYDFLISILITNIELEFQYLQMKVELLSPNVEVSEEK